MPSIANLDTASYTQWAGFIGDTAAFADAEGFLRLLSNGEQRIAMHDGLLEAKTSRDGRSLVTSGEDGKIFRLHPTGDKELLHEQPNKWIDKLACGPDGVVAYGAGRDGGIVFPDGKFQELEVERTIEGLAFAPKGMRLAVARYDGVELHWINSKSPMQFLEWKGAHTDVMFSPDGKYVVTTMQENALHGWRLSDNKHMRMSGYPAKVASTSWAPKGKWLATSGAQAAIVWPFSGKDGPLNKAPKELGSMGKLMVSQVSCHPGSPMLAIGYSDGMILGVRIEDGKTVSLRRGGEGPISTMNWDREGARLCFGSEAGEAGVINIAD